MGHWKQIIASLQSGEAGPALARLYGGAPKTLREQAGRYVRAVEAFHRLYPEQAEIELFSSPGRTEVGGNHTDHNGGRILAAAVDLDILAVAARNDDRVLRVTSAGYSTGVVGLEDLTPQESERYTSAALARGVCARFQALGCQPGGFDAYVTSTIPKGSGLSSSAAYELLVAVIENDLYNGSRLDPLPLARIAQFSENQFFGKPCGLMDQSAVAVGGLVFIDFQDFERPLVRQVEVDFSRSGYTVMIVDTGGSHADLNDDYAALEREMKSVARAFGGQVLREFSAQKVLENLAYLRTRVSDRAILRALHFYADDQRVVEMVAALERDDFAQFMRLVIASGESSWMLCQNVYTHKDIEHQGISIALAATQNLLKGRGAWRVHGGGFAGTILAFVPDEQVEEYTAGMEAIFGAGACHALRIRPAGACRLAFGEMG